MLTETRIRLKIMLYWGIVISTKPMILAWSSFVWDPLECLHLQSLLFVHLSISILFVNLSFWLCCVRCPMFACAVVFLIILARHCWGCSLSICSLFFLSDRVCSVFLPFPSLPFPSLIFIAVLPIPSCDFVLVWLFAIPFVLCILGLFVLSFVPLCCVFWSFLMGGRFLIGNNVSTF